MASPNRVSPLISGRAKGVLDIRTRRWEFRYRSYGALRFISLEKPDNRDGSRLRSSSQNDTSTLILRLHFLGASPPSPDSGLSFDSFL
jgi:hypothetical protein